MRRYAIIFLILALVAAVFGFGGLAGPSQGIARILFFLLLVVFMLTFVAGLQNGKWGGDG